MTNSVVVGVGNQKEHLGWARGGNFLVPALVKRLLPYLSSCVYGDSKAHSSVIVIYNCWVKALGYQR